MESVDGCVVVFGSLVDALCCALDHGSSGGVGFKVERAQSTKARLKNRVSSTLLSEWAGPYYATWAPMLVVSCIAWSWYLNLLFT